MKRIVVSVICTMILLTSCQNESTDVLNDEGIESENLREVDELQLQIDELNKIINEKDDIINEAEMKIGNLVPDVSENYKFFAVNNSEYLGHGIAELEINLMSAPYSSSNVMGSISDLLYILCEVKNENNESWYLVRSPKTLLIGFVEVGSVTKYFRSSSYITHSKASVSDLQLGDSIAVVINELGDNYTRIKLDDFLYLEAIKYDNGNESSVIVFYDPVSKLVTQLRFTAQDLKVDDRYGVGDEVYELSHYFQENYQAEVNFELDSNLMSVNLENNYKFDVFYDSHNIITKIDFFCETIVEK